MLIFCIKKMMTGPHTGPGLIGPLLGSWHLECEKLTWRIFQRRQRIEKLKMTVDTDKGKLETATSGQPHLAKQVS